MPIRNSAMIKKTLLRKYAALGIPGSGIFELTPRCNLRCKMCYVRLTPQEMASIGTERTADEWISLAQSAKDAGLTFLLLTGGEPTLRNDFIEIYEALAQMGLSLSINTNATLLTSSLRESWHKLPPPQVNITLYGTCHEDYAAFCGDPTAFEKVCDAIDWLQSENILIHLNTTMTPQNLSCWQALEDFALARNLELRMTNYCFPPRRRSKCASCHEFERLSPEDAGRMIVQDLFYRNGIEKIKQRLRESEINSTRNCISNNTDLPMQCLAGRAQFWATWDGRILPCGMFDFPAAYPFEVGFDTAWSQLKSACASIRLPAECLNCPDRGICLNCAAVTYSETGHFDGKPEYMCALNRAYKESLLDFIENHV